MTKSELKEIIRETILAEMVNTPSEHKKINSKLMQIAQRGVNDVKEDEEKIYYVTYYIIDKNDNDIDYDEDVKATSKEEAIAKVKAHAPRNARAFSAQLK